MVRPTKQYSSKAAGRLTGLPRTRLPFLALKDGANGAMQGLNTLVSVQISIGSEWHGPPVFPTLLTYNVPPLSSLKNPSRLTIALHINSAEDNDCAFGGLRIL